jgi:Transcriptional regulator containing an amidase domain and an AraC-type DNA-binding HTH domain
MFSFDEPAFGDADSLVEAYGRLAPDADVDIGRGGKEFSWRGRYYEAGAHGLLRLSCNAEWQAVSRQEKRNFCITIPTEGAVRGRIAGHDYLAGKGQALLTAGPHISQIDVLCQEGHTRSVLKWDLAEVERLLAADFEEIALDDLMQAPLLDFQNPEGRILGNMLAAMADGVIHAGRHSALTLELLSEATLRLIFDHAVLRRGGSSPRPPRRFTIVPRHIKQAIDIMQHRLSEPVRILDIAQACGVSPRALEEGFRHFKGTTPSAYLRRLRLDAVRRDLRNGSGRIADVALRWGFSSPGRFSRQYYAAFGERPSETLRRG